MIEHYYYYYYYYSYYYYYYYYWRCSGKRAEIFLPLMLESQKQTVEFAAVGEEVLNKVLMIAPKRTWLQSQNVTPGIELSHHYLIKHSFLLNSKQSKLLKRIMYCFSPGDKTMLGL